MDTALRLSARGFRLFCGRAAATTFARRPGNAQTLFPGISYSTHRNPEAWECAGARQRLAEAD